MNLTESNNTNPLLILLISMNENIDDGKCDRKVYKVIACGNNKWQNKNHRIERSEKEEAINSWVSKRFTVQSHVHSLSINIARLMRKNRQKKILSKKEQKFSTWSSRNLNDLNSTTPLPFFSQLKLFLFLFCYCWYFLSFLLDIFLLFVTLPNMLSYWFILFRSNNTKKK